MAKKLEDIFIDGTSFNVEVNAAKTEEEFIEFKKESGVFAKAGDKQTDALKAAYAKIKEQKAINDKIDNPEPEAARWSHVP